MPTPFDELNKKIGDKTLTVGVIGLGYVGLPLSIAVASKNINVIGFDVLKSRASMLNEGRSYLKGIDNKVIQGMLDSNNFSATDNMTRLDEPDVLIICVPTPLSKNREPDLSYVSYTAETISKYIRKGQLIALESTTYPGTTSELIKPIIEKSGLKSGEDFFLAYSPEREDPGNIDFSTATISKVVGGSGEHATELANKIYSIFIDKVVPVSSTRVAEAVKLTENIFRSINIALVNELKVIFSHMDIDIWEVIDAAATKPFGYMPFYPGPGLGGHCIPIDPFYLTWKAHEFDISTRFIELAGEINCAMPEYVVSNTAKALNTHLAKAMNGSKILVVGVAYKRDVDDYRESPSFDVIAQLRKRLATVDYYDPFIPSLDTEEVGQMNSIELSKETIAEYDAVVICTNHSNIDWQELADNAPLIMDTRNATSELKSSKAVIIKS